VANVLRARWRNLIEGLWFVPLLIVLGMGVLAVALVRLDENLIGHSTPWVFGGNASAARVVLSTIAGSLITVAGLPFSVTMVVLQLASSQFSPRVLPNFLADRLTQVTVGAFVGIFVFCLIGLRAVGGRHELVPRLTVTVASGLGVVAVILLIAFIHHVSTMIQVSHIAARIGRRTLQQLDVLYPRSYGEEAEQEGGTLREQWRQDGDPARILPPRPGYVQEVDLDALARTYAGGGVRLHVPVAPGDFAGVGTAIVEVWPADAAAGCETATTRTVTIASERTFAQDVDFGVRQLTDIALRAISPAVNDPTTAVTCIGYVRSVLERLAGRDFPSRVRRWPDDDVVVVARRRAFDEHLELLLQLAPYSNGDARVIGALLDACRATAVAAREAGADGRATAALDVAEQIAAATLEEVRTRHDRRRVEELLSEVRAVY
jgi:uncharacterized membrane protein